MTFDSVGAVEKERVGGARTISKNIRLRRSVAGSARTRI